MARASSQDKIDIFKSKERAEQLIEELRIGVEDRLQRGLSTTLWAGLDTGANGAFAFLWDAFIPGMPPILFARFDHLKYSDVFDVLRYVKPHAQYCLAERVVAVGNGGDSGTGDNRRKSSGSVWSQAQNYGAQMLLLELSGLRYDLVMPSSWQKGLPMDHSTKGPDRKTALCGALAKILPDLVFVKTAADSGLLAIKAYEKAGHSLANIGRGTEMGQGT